MAKLKLELGEGINKNDYQVTSDIIDSINEQLSLNSTIKSVSVVWADDEVVITLESGKQLRCAATGMRFYFDGTGF